MQTTITPFSHPCRSKPCPAEIVARQIMGLLLLSCLLFQQAAALTPHCSRPTARDASTSRRSALAGLFGLGAASLPVAPLPALALITGSKPPEGGFKAKERKCKSIDECEALGAKKEQEKYADVDTSFERTAGGDRYRDLSTGSGRAAAKGDAVEIRYRVMRLGTRARDGLSGEGQTIFSFGFGEDEDKEGEKVCRVLGPRTCGPAGRVTPIPSRTRLRAPCWRS